MSRVNITGRLISSSHLFYLSQNSRVFILTLQSLDTSLVSHVFCSLSASLQSRTKNKCKELLVKPPYRRILTISKTKPVSVSNTDNLCKVFQLTKSSTIIETEEGGDQEAGLLNPVPTSCLGIYTKYQRRSKTKKIPSCYLMFDVSVC